jgi:hypothetical protein
MKTLKSIILTYIILGFLANNAISQTNLTPAQQKEYNQKKITLDLRKIGMGSYGSGSISYSSWNKWDAHQGFKKIKESEFYSIAGYGDMAAKAKKRETRGKVFVWGGIGMALGGCALMLATTDSDSGAPLLVGGVAALAGIFFEYWGVGIHTTNMQPYGVASGIADEYNTQLSISIRRNF